MIKELNIDYTVATNVHSNTSEFSRRLEKMYPTPIADKLLRDNPEMNRYDEHKLFK